MATNRYDDYDLYQMLCDHLWIHQNKRRALFVCATGDFYVHAKELLQSDEHGYRVAKIKNTAMYTRFID